jgi:hypothetical protein
MQGSWQGGHCINITHSGSNRLLGVSIVIFGGRGGQRVLVVETTSGRAWKLVLDHA